MNELGQSTINPSNQSNEFGQSTSSINQIPSFGSPIQRNELIKILEAFPDNPWNMGLLSGNPNITLDYIDSHPEFDWVYGGYQSFGQSSISSNPNLTLNYIYDHPNESWNWNRISCNPAFTLKDIEENDDLPWRPTYILNNPNVTLDYILENKDIYKNLHEGMTAVGININNTPNITVQDMETYPDIFQDRWIISYNSNLTLEFVFNHKKFTSHWNWFGVGMNINNTFEEIIKLNKDEDDDFFQDYQEIQRLPLILSKIILIIIGTCRVCVEILLLHLNNLKYYMNQIQQIIINSWVLIQVLHLTGLGKMKIKHFLEEVFGKICQVISLCIILILSSL